MRAITVRLGILVFALVALFVWACGGPPASDTGSPEDKQQQSPESATESLGGVLSPTTASAKGPAQVSGTDQFERFLEPGTTYYFCYPPYQGEDGNCLGNLELIEMLDDGWAQVRRSQCRIDNSYSHPERVDCIPHTSGERFWLNLRQVAEIRLPVPALDNY